MRVLPAGPEALDAAAAALEADDIVLVPTDTVYGIGIRAAAPGAAARLAAVKDRPHDQSVAVLVGSIGQAHDIAAFDVLARTIVAALWPGPLTLVVPRGAGVDWELGDTGPTIGVRWPADPVIEALARRVGPLAVTSANRHGEPTPPTARSAAEAVGGRVAVVIDGGPCRAEPSTVLVVTDGGLEVVREGAIPVQDVLVALGAESRGD